MNENPANDKSPINSQILGEYLTGNGLMNNSSDMKNVGENALTEM